MLVEAPSGFVPTDLPTGSILHAAVTSVARCNEVTPQAVLARLEAGDKAIHSSFRYWLAKHVATYLGALDVVFRAFYVYGSAIGFEANPASDIDVIVVVDRACDEVKNLIRQVDLALTTAYRRLLGFSQDPKSLLDIGMVERTRQAELRTDRDGVCCGLHTRPICLWRSDPGSNGGSLAGSPRQSNAPLRGRVSPR